MKKHKFIVIFLFVFIISFFAISFLSACSCSAPQDQCDDPPIGGYGLVKWMQILKFFSKLHKKT